MQCMGKLNTEWPDQKMKLAKGEMLASQPRPQKETSLGEAVILLRTP